jgi:hypothetical protein
VDSGSFPWFAGLKPGGYITLASSRGPGRPASPDWKSGASTLLPWEGLLGLEVRGFHHEKGAGAAAG